jgi:hydroxymethylpyrimidine pyrophosphatase-like HAD family hydrolase
VLGAFPEVGIETYRVDGVFGFHPNRATLSHFINVGIENPSWAQRIEDIPLPWLKVIYTHENEYLVRIAQWFSERYADRFDLVFSSPHLLEMQSPDTGKGRGTARLAALLGIDEKDVYCAGDQQNDLAMVSRFISFAPENCVDEIRSAATYIVSDCDEHAIRDAIGILDRIY